jgi:hypothetical protein
MSTLQPRGKQMTVDEKSISNLMYNMMCAPSDIHSVIASARSSEADAQRIAGEVRDKWEKFQDENDCREIITRSQVKLIAELSDNVGEVDNSMDNMYYVRLGRKRAAERIGNLLALQKEKGIAAPSTTEKPKLPPWHVNASPTTNRVKESFDFTSPAKNSNVPAVKTPVQPATSARSKGADASAVAASANKGDALAAAMKKVGDLFLILLHCNIGIVNIALIKYRTALQSNAISNCSSIT